MSIEMSNPIESCKSMLHGVISPLTVFRRPTGICVNMYET
jgi:hypothetical protein